MAKSVCIVGAGPGLGRACALRFAREGFVVALLARKEETCTETMALAKEAGAAKAAFVQCDVGSDESVAKAAKEVEALAGGGPPDCLIYNPGGGGIGSGGVTEVPIATVVTAINVQAIGLLRFSQAWIPAMRERKAGKILVTSATSAFRGSKNGPAFPMAKFALRGLSQSIAKECAADGIHCAHIRLDCVLDGAAAKYGIPLEKTGRTADIANTYFHLFSQKPGCWSNEVDLRPYTEDWTF